MSQIKKLQKQLNNKQQIDFLHERLVRYTQKYNSPLQIAFHLANSALLSWKKVKTSHNSKPTDKLRIGIVLEGGLGDVLIGLNWLCNIHNKFFINQSNVKIDVGNENLNLLEFFAPKFISSCYPQKRIEKKKYDVFIRVIRCPQVEYANLSLVKKYNPQFLELLIRYLDLENENKIFYTLSCYRDSVSHNLPFFQPKRWNQADVDGSLQVKEHFLLPISLVNEDKVLQKFSLFSKKFITINREVGVDSTCESTKLWPLTYYRELTKALKKSYPDYKIIEIGTGKGERIENTHENLAGKTSLEEIKVILKHAALHIDSEGGLVHLRHVVAGGPSVVFFGPTDPNIYGYSENLNLRGNGCPRFCEHLTNNWQKKCILNLDHICMKSLTVDTVLNHIQQKQLL